jgi:hypothetical protein
MRMTCYISICNTAHYVQCMYMVSTTVRSIDTCKYYTTCVMYNVYVMYFQFYFMCILCRNIRVHGILFIFCVPLLLCIVLTSGKGVNITLIYINPILHKVSSHYVYLPAFVMSTLRRARKGSRILQGQYTLINT